MLSGFIGSAAATSHSCLAGRLGSTVAFAARNAARALPRAAVCAPARAGDVHAVLLPSGDSWLGVPCRSWDWFSQALDFAGTQVLSCRSKAPKPVQEGLCTDRWKLPQLDESSSASPPCLRSSVLCQPLDVQSCVGLAGREIRQERTMLTGDHER